MNQQQSQIHTVKCKYGAQCIHLKNTGNCNYYHPKSEIPCYHGPDCDYNKQGLCQFYHDPQQMSQKQQGRPNQKFQDYNYFFKKTNEAKEQGFKQNGKTFFCKQFFQELQNEDDQEEVYDNQNFTQNQKNQQIPNQKQNRQFYDELEQNPPFKQNEHKKQFQENYKQPYHDNQQTFQQGNKKYGNQRQQYQQQQFQDDFPMGYEQQPPRRQYENFQYKRQPKQYSDNYQNPRKPQQNQDDFHFKKQNFHDYEEEEQETDKYHNQRQFQQQYNNSYEQEDFNYKQQLKDAKTLLNEFTAKPYYKNHGPQKPEFYKSNQQAKFQENPDNNRIREKNSQGNEAEMYNKPAGQAYYQKNKNQFQNYQNYQKPTQGRTQFK